MQGKTSKGRKRPRQKHTLTDGTTFAVVEEEDTLPNSTETQFLKGADQLRTTTSSNPRLHFGTNHIIRQWFLLAFARKSFRLLEAATKLANKFNISMEQIVQGKFLPDEWLLAESSPYTVNMRNTTNLCCHWRMMDRTSHANANDDLDVKPATNTALTISEIPSVVWQAMRCSTFINTTTTSSDVGGNHTQNSRPEVDRRLCDSDPVVHSRWIFVRETRYDQVRFFVSANFSRDIATLETIQQTWEDNQREVKELWMVVDQHQQQPLKSDKTYSQNFVHLVLSYVEPNSHPAPIRSNNKTIRLKKDENGQHQHVNVDFIQYYRIMNLDVSYMVSEFIPSRDFISPFATSSHGRTETTDSNGVAVGNVEGADSAVEFLDKFEDFEGFDVLPNDPDLEWIGELIFNDT